MSEQQVDTVTDAADDWAAALAEQASTTATITQKALTVSGITAANKTYDGGTTATISTANAAAVQAAATPNLINRTRGNANAFPFTVNPTGATRCAPPLAAWATSSPPPSRQR